MAKGSDIAVGAGLGALALFLLTRGDGGGSLGSGGATGGGVGAEGLSTTGGGGGITPGIDASTPEGFIQQRLQPGEEVLSVSGDATRLNLSSGRTVFSGIAPRLIGSDIAFGPERLFIEEPGREVSASVPPPGPAFRREALLAGERDPFEGLIGGQRDPLTHTELVGDVGGRETVHAGEERAGGFIADVTSRQALADIGGFVGGFEFLRGSAKVLGRTATTANAATVGAGVGLGAVEGLERVGFFDAVRRSGGATRRFVDNTLGDTGGEAVEKVVKVGTAPARLLGGTVFRVNRFLFG